jgi:diguanylate cyclase (GGDEF)-like protein
MSKNNFSFHIFVLSLITISAIIYFGFYLKNFFKNSQNIAYKLTHLKGHELDINYEIIKSSVYLYVDNDLINKKIAILNESLNKLLKDKFLKENFPMTYHNLKIYKKLIAKKEKNIYDFLVLNSIIKNSLALIPNLITQEISLCKNNKKYLNTLIKIDNELLFIKNALDKDFISNLKQQTQKLKSFHFQNPQIEGLNSVLIKTLDNFIINFIRYKKLFLSVTNIKTIEFIDEKILKEFFLENSKIEKKLNFLLIIFSMLIIIVAIIINYLYNRLTKEYKKVEKAKLQIEKLYLTSTLTNLPNRIALNKDIKKYSTLMLFNIDRFQHINDIYGNDIGDKIIREVGKKLKELSNTNVYHLGGDEFAILYDEIDDPYQKAKEIIDYFKQNPIVIEDKQITISASIGISDTHPQLEKADLVLKEIKNNKTTNIKIYSPELQLENKIKEKMEKASILQEAIETNNIVPVFQPIINNKTMQIWKYEALARIKHNNELISIFPFLEIAKETNLYKQITLIMFQKVYDIFKSRKDGVSFNLSTADIIDKDIHGFILDILKNDINFASRLTFEILESESIKDYTIVKDFIEEVKEYGVCIAIDDFGSGYSNFEHLLNMEIDIIKIDGSLIKKITTNDLIVRTIVNFCKEANIKSVAEFVANEDILNKVKEIGIDYSQGFYLGKPTTL